MRAVAGFTVQASATIVATKLLSSIVGASATWLTTTTTATGLLRFLVGNGGWQCRNSRTETFWKAKRHGANTRQTFDVFHITTLVTSNEAHCNTFTAGTRGAADTVDILFRHVGQFEVEHMADAGDVDAAGRNVGCNKDFDLAVTERLQCSGALTLRFVAMDGG